MFYGTESKHNYWDCPTYSNSSIPTSYVRGLTISSKSEIRHMSPGMIYLDAVSRRLVSTQAATVVRVEESRSVSAVLVLYGMPRDLTASILAHEAMHVWLKLNKDVPFELQPQVSNSPPPRLSPPIYIAVT